MQHREALVFYSLLAISLDVVFEEVETRLVRINRYAQLTLLYLLTPLPQVGANGLDALGTLQILLHDNTSQVPVQFEEARVIFDAHHGHDFGEHSPEPLHIPVLVNYLVDYSCLKHLMSFVGQKIHQVVHIVNCLGVLHIAAQPLGKELLAENEDERAEVGVARQFDVLFRSYHARFYFVAHGCQEGEDEGLAFPDGGRHGGLVGRWEIVNWLGIRIFYYFLIILFINQTIIANQESWKMISLDF